MHAITCARCQYVFAPHQVTKSNGKGKPRYCLECNEIRKLEREDRRKRRTSKDRNRWNLYGMEAEDYEEMFRRQGGVCAICGEPPTGKDLAVDHCHTSGDVRGLLCTRCNIGLGYFKDDEERLKKAIAYLRGLTGHYVTLTFRQR